MARPRNTPALYITARDEKILRALAEHRFLSIPQLAVLFFPSKGAAEARLRKLLAHRYVVQVFMPVRPYDRRSQVIYSLGARGSYLLAAKNNGKRPRHLSPSEQRSGYHLDHTLRRNDLRIALTRLTDAHNDLTLLRWLQSPEDIKAKVAINIRPGRMRTVTVIPDGLFTLKHPGGIEHFIVEIDRGTVGLDRMRLRYRAYWTWWRRGGLHRRYGPAPFRVLTLAPPSTEKTSRLERLRTAAMDAPESGDTGCGLFWFASQEVADIQAPEKLLGAAWSVAYKPPQLAQPLLAL